MNKMNVSQEIKIIKRNQKKFKPNYNNWNEKFTRRVQWHFRGRKPSELEAEAIEMIWSEEQKGKKKMKQKEESLRDLYQNVHNRSLGGE